ncbi:hypothetical protein Pmar_PMAR002610 [Perkinsus marinus ATCC 50983]|uniref:Uncharacterized protein n=1 Tax=Perkinsus marinus (strain ATCC 50983 / TXsc) TaxID=423536 RepID=C5LNR5_PERM5|nr:hypothetical protein Pmar_PMAR002610 [Perkinsus marinus ATCC 50983]EER01616.1 hypothetical protein Pmar_PMAR002610 [Perkinsus marinus ATCC 50983]|eukprot:XP_002768898.1 hypothetical protein Pmar_PMAR002610 [Perkinsus marinus ATCC 50983]
MDSAVTGSKKRKGGGGNTQLKYVYSGMGGQREFVSHCVELWNAYHLKKGKNKKKIPLSREVQKVLAKAGYDQKSKHFNDKGLLPRLRGKKLRVVWYQPEERILACNDDKGELLLVSDVVVQRGACKREEEVGLFSTRARELGEACSFVHFEDDIVGGVGDLFDPESSLHKREGIFENPQHEPKRFKAHLSIGAKTKINPGFAARKATPKRNTQKEAKFDFNKGTIATALFPHRPDAVEIVPNTWKELSESSASKRTFTGMVKVVYGKKSTLQQEVKLEVDADVDSLNDLRRALGVPVVVEALPLAATSSLPLTTTMEINFKVTKKNALKVLGDEKKIKKYFVKTDIATPSRITSDGEIDTDVVLHEGKMRPRVVVVAEPLRWKVTDHSATGPVRIWRDERKFKEFTATVQFHDTPRSIFEKIFKGPLVRDEGGQEERERRLPVEDIEQRRIDIVEDGLNGYQGNFNTAAGGYDDDEEEDEGTEMLHEDGGNGREDQEGEYYDDENLLQMFDDGSGRIDDDDGDLTFSFDD